MSSLLRIIDLGNLGMSDPSDEVVEVLVKCMEWNIVSHQHRLLDADLARLQELAVELLDLSNWNLPDKCGEKGRWNFYKAHSILHKVCEIIMWGNSINTSYQSAEHAHRDIDLINLKSVAGCRGANNKDVFMCILRFHPRLAYLQHYQTLLQELEGSEEPFAEAPSKQESGADSCQQQCTLLDNRSFNVSCQACETGIHTHHTRQCVAGRQCPSESEAPIVGEPNAHCSITAHLVDIPIIYHS